MIKMSVYEQILIYIFVELYKNNNTGLTKLNILSMRNGNCTEKKEIKYQGYYFFCFILDHVVLPVRIAYVCDTISYMCYINKYLKYIYW